MHQLLWTLISEYLDQHISLFLRYIDDIFCVWNASQPDFREKAVEFCSRLNTEFRDYNFEITWIISDKDAIFLDVRLWFGNLFATTGKLDVATHQKPINRYLYLPYYTAHPKHVLTGFIRGEFRRYLIRSSDVADYIDILIAFYNRLRARAYPADFLRPLFMAAPDFSQREALLFADSSSSRSAASIPFVLKLTFAHDVMQLGLQQALADAKGTLPAYLRATRRLVVFKRAPRLGDMLSRKRPTRNDIHDSMTPPQPAREVPRVTMVTSPS